VFSTRLYFQRTGISPKKFQSLESARPHIPPLVRWLENSRVHTRPTRALHPRHAPKLACCDPLGPLLAKHICHSCERSPKWKLSRRNGPVCITGREKPRALSLQPISGQNIQYYDTALRRVQEKGSANPRFQGIGRRQGSNISVLGGDKARAGLMRAARS